SLASLQTLPTVHFWHAGAPWKVLPPQSLSDSSPFFTPSLHVGVAHFFVLSQYAVAQSEFCLHDLPTAHVLPWLTHGPPQSLSVSCEPIAPSCLLSEQVAAAQVPEEQLPS